MSGTQDQKPDQDNSYPFRRLLGFELVEWREDYAKIHLPLRSDFGNRSGLPHGGIHATLLDSAMGHAGNFDDPPKLALTLTLNVSYLSRPLGTLLIAEGFRTGGGQRTYFADGRVTDETGELIATGSGAFRYRNA